eukprot:gnl/Chilomastix_caulleri/1794.p1 GENE.gnl/Chilomastix_caulleri/1794~~gnl/Chilomastix_caulleri/1794.p1  ORF type:complete len:168 (+),score=30.10 gnl/Chilomastix_caulleri/1794:44-547(+)
MATKEMCKFAFDYLRYILKDMKTKPSDDAIPSQSFPLFVTFHKLDRHGEYQLRGCIGTLSRSSPPLKEGLKRFTVAAALEDPRFDPIDILEVPKLMVDISLLVNFHEVDNPFDWVVGKHGVNIEFLSGSRRYSSVFLPCVAEEQHWDQRTTIEQPCTKGQDTTKKVR